MRPAVWLVACGLVVALGVPVGWWASHRGAGSTTPVRPGEAVALAPSSPSPVVTTPTSPTAPTAALPPVPTVAGAPSALPTAAVVVPVRLQVPSLDIDAPVDAMGLEPDGAMALPEQVGRVGWYRFGADPGSPQGATVVAGHVDSAVQGEGAMFALRDAAAGAQVLLTTADGRTLTYVVTSREEFAKSSVPLDAIFATTGVPRLTLITCGGTFDSTARSYEDNIVVTAVPA